MKDTKKTKRFIELENSIIFHLNIHYKVNTYNITLKLSPTTCKTMDAEDQFKQKQLMNKNKSGWEESSKWTRVKGHAETKYLCLVTNAGS